MPQSQSNETSGRAPIDARAPGKGFHGDVVLVLSSGWRHSRIRPRTTAPTVTFLRRASACKSVRSLSDMRTVIRVPLGSFDFPTIVPYGVGPTWGWAVIVSRLILSCFIEGSRYCFLW